MVKNPPVNAVGTSSFPGLWVTATAKSLQSCPTLCNPIDSSPLGSSVPGILQARILEWVAISFSNAGKWKVKVKSLSRVRLLGTPLTTAYQAPPSMGFSRQEYWIWGGAVIIITAMKCTIHIMCLNHPEIIPHPSPWKNGVPRKWSLVPNRLETTDLQALTFRWVRGQ